MGLCALPGGRLRRIGAYTSHLLQRRIVNNCTDILGVPTDELGAALIYFTVRCFPVPWRHELTSFSGQRYRTSQWVCSAGAC